MAANQALELVNKNVIVIHDQTKTIPLFNSYNYVY